MRHLGTILVGLAACHHGGGTAPPPSNRAPAPSRAIAIVDDAGGVRRLDPVTGALRAAPELRITPDVTAVEGRDDTLALTVHGQTRAIAWPERGVNAWALSPDGTHLAVCAGPTALNGDVLELDLYLLDVAGDRFARLTHTDEIADVAWLDDDTMLLLRGQAPTRYQVFHLASRALADLTVPPAPWKAMNLDTYPITAPRVIVFNEDTQEDGLLDLRDGSVIPYPQGDRVLAVAPGGAAAAIAGDCGALREVRVEGAREVRGAPASCTENPPISAAYTDDGVLVYAVRGGAGWQVIEGDRVVVEAPGRLRVIAIDTR